MVNINLYGHSVEHREVGQETSLGDRGAQKLGQQWGQSSDSPGEGETNTHDL